MTCYRKATVCTVTMRKGYNTAGQSSPIACQQELTLQRQHAPLLRMSAAADSMLTGLKASRPLNCVLIVNDNYKLTNCFIEFYESRMVHR
jgi:hypothetical protein